MDATDDWIPLEWGLSPETHHRSAWQSEKSKSKTHFPNPLLIAKIDFDPDNRVILSTHLWQGELPSNLQSGVRCIRTRTTDMHGLVHWGYRFVGVVKGSQPLRRVCNARRLGFFLSAVNNAMHARSGR